MASRCWASTRGEIARFTALDNCCTPVNNPCGVVVTDGFISVVLSQTVEAAAAITTKNAADRVCVYDPGCDSLLDLTAVITLCQVNPELLGVTTGQEVVLDYAGVAVGTRQSDFNCDLRFALEVWTKVPGTACVGTPPVQQYGYFLVPCLQGATITGEITIDGANSVSLELTAKTRIPSGWGTGPNTLDEAYYVVASDALNNPSLLLSPIGSRDHDHMQLTTIAPPVTPDDCGCTQLVIAGPPDVLAVTLNNPPTFGPANALPAAGGTSIRITGTNFLGATDVEINNVNVASFVVVDNFTITAVTVATLAGTYGVEVTTPLGIDTLANAVTFV